MELTWSLQYCFACDRQTQGEAYCSQSCRLADLEMSSTWSGLISPTTSHTTQSSRSSGFYLSPAINFATCKTSDKGSLPAADQNHSPLASYYPGHGSSHGNASKTITPSTSQSSLSSTQTSSPPANRLSEQARIELLGYTNSFDNIRNWRRRSTWS